MENTIEFWIEALAIANVFGVGFSVIIVTIVNLVKGKINLPDESPRWIATGLGVVLGSLYLLYASPWGAAETLPDYVTRIAAAIIWAFTIGPRETYEAVKRTVSSGFTEAVHKVEEAATLSLGEPPDQLVG